MNINIRLSQIGFERRWEKDLHAASVVVRVLDIKVSKSEKKGAIEFLIVTLHVFPAVRIFFFLPH